MHISEFTYHLPQHSIAQFPACPRDSAKLMLLDKATKKIEHSTFLQLDTFLRPGDILVANNSKVIPARLLGTKENGREVEIFLLHRRDKSRLVPTDKVAWECLVKPGLKEGTIVTFAFKNKNLSATVVKDQGMTRLIEFHFDLERHLNAIGQTPLPPYITPTHQKTSWYQTIYAYEKGSVAAPTAGLHFTPRLLKKLENKGIEMLFVTLHVGLGTFQPVKVENIQEHHMHAELGCISREVAQKIYQAKQDGRRIIAVGTTTTRLLEYFSTPLLSPLVKGRINEGIDLSDWINIFIYPPYQFKIIDGLITNFHLPQSTLLMMVSALAGREYTLQAYEEAKRNDYKFYSFGDGMLIL